MKSRTKTSLLILALFAALAALATLRAQSQNNPASPHQDNLKKAEGDFYTVTDYSAPEPTDPVKRALRRERATRYNMRAQKGVDTRRFMITDERESSFGTPPFDVPPGPALPASTSDAIVIGEVTQAQAFLTEDKTSIISEFTVQLSKVLKNKSLAPLAHGKSIDTIRGGGGVRLPSGKVIRRGMWGRPLPRVGRKYVFFLKYDREGHHFEILTAYELCSGRICPLDGTNRVGSASDRYPDYQRYKEADEATFLNEVKQAIANHPEGEGR